ERKPAYTPRMHALAVALVLLHGVVSRGPTRPVCEIGQPCSEPTATTLVFSRAGAVVARVRSAGDGRYSVRLRPGTYDVRLAVQPRIGTGMNPRTVTLRRVRAVHVDFMVDT